MKHLDIGALFCAAMLSCGFHLLSNDDVLKPTMDSAIAGHTTSTDASIDNGGSEKQKSDLKIKAQDTLAEDGLKEFTLDDRDKTLVKDIVEILHNMKDERNESDVSPFRIDLLRGIVKRLNPQADLEAPHGVDGAHAPETGSSTDTCRIFPAKIIAAQRILYIRLDELSPGSYERLSDDITTAIRLSTKPPRYGH